MTMMILIKNILLAFLLASLMACGADKLNPKMTASINGLNAGNTCQCTSENSPVCSSDGIDYGSSCLANCFGKTIKNKGHCDCASNSIMICGSDGNDHTECEARDAKIQITKYVPCSVKEL